MAHLVILGNWGVVVDFVETHGVSYRDPEEAAVSPMSIQQCRKTRTEQPPAEAS